MQDAADRPATLVDLLCARAVDSAHKEYVFLLDERSEAMRGGDPAGFAGGAGSKAPRGTNERQEARLSFAELHARASGIAAELRRRAPAGAPALLLYPPGIEYICGFFGCLLGPVVAVPAYPPDPGRLDRSLRRLIAIVEDARPALVLTTRFVRNAIAPLLASVPALARLDWIATDDIAPAADVAPPRVGPETTAFLQYTSGSTGTPKGVVLDHANLIANSIRIRDAFGHTAEGRGVIWLPPYHDMGLIGGILQPLYSGFDVVLMSPLDFLKRPLRWLEAISRYRATVSGGPNFAYDLAVRKSTPAERAALDLSSWELAFNGAEPVRSETLDRFAEAFAPSGFRPEAFFPCYGLAESTLIAAGGPRGARPRVLRVQRDALASGRAEPDAGGDMTLVGCGRPSGDGRLVIVDPARARVCGEREVGEIWLAGGSVARGYVGKPEETARMFGARLAEGDDQRFLRTGDLGFLDGGELFVAGRIKDLIIVRGRNHDPSDLEYTVELAQPAIRQGCVAALQLGVDDPRLVVVAELAPRTAAYEPAELAAIGGGLRGAIAEVHELAVHAVVLVRAGVLPKTSSGKLERYACREAYLQGALPELVRDVLPARDVAADEPADSSPRTPPGRDARADDSLRARLARTAAALLGVADVPHDQPLAMLGLDSVLAMELATTLEAELGVALTPVELLDGATIDRIAQHIEAARGAISLSNEAAGRGPATTAIPVDRRVAPGADRDEYPLSVGQRALWFLQLVAPDSAAYNVWLAARVEAGEPDRWRAAFQRLADRHPSLRAAVVVRSGVPWQRVTPRPIDFEIVDTSEISEAALRERMTAEAHRPFDLAAGVFRVRWYRRDRGGALLVVAHHLAVDLWSAGVLFAELAAPVAGPLAEVRPFADQVDDERAWLAGADGAAAWAHWRTRLAGSLPALALPADKPRPRASAFRGGAVAFDLPGAMAQRIRRLARDENTTPYAVLLAAFATLLHRLTDQDDLWIGSPIAGRQPGFQRTVGYFVNTIVIRTDTAGDPTFRALIGRTRAAVLEAMAHGAMPLATLAERLGAGVQRAPLFHALFALERAPATAALAPFLAGARGRVELLGATLDALALEHRAAAVDLALVLFEGAGDAGDPDALRGSWRFDAELFLSASVERWSRQLRTLLAALLDAPDRRIGDAVLDADGAPRALLVEAAPPDARLLHHMIEDQARERPHARAVVAADTALTYSELDARADRLAAVLRDLGAGPERAVAVLVDRSVDWAVAVLGVLKSGGVYLPLEPTLPDERLGYLLDDTRAVAVVTTASHAGRVAGRPAVRIDEQMRVVGDGLAARPAGSPVAPHPDAAAYVIYTSGSTGTPKGVVVSHRNACNLVAAQRRTFAVAPACRVLQYASCAFDASVFELALALAVGAELHVVPAASVLPGPALVRLLRDRAITTVTFPPSVLAALPPDQLPDIHTVISAGEACPREVVARWAAGRRFFNAYGPTEATVWSTVAQLAPSDERPPIGLPVSGASACVLDRRGQPAPDGAVGELAVGGASVARGYLGRPALTAERFIPDPDGPPGSRRYRTGDLARLRPDGALDLLGRIDDQVKIRGFRVEPGEVEAALRAHPGVRDAGVVPRADRHGEPQLVAYLAGADLALEQVRAFLRGRGLPDYLLPAAVVTLDALPRMPSGKLDRRALPAPAPAARAHLTAASGDLEASILAVFREVLGHDQIGATDHFFEVLGGSSLAVVRACALLGERAGLTVEVTAIFEHPTVRALAAHLGGAPAAAAPPDHDERARGRAAALRRRRS